MLLTEKILIEIFNHIKNETTWCINDYLDRDKEINRKTAKKAFNQLIYWQYIKPDGRKRYKLTDKGLIKLVRAKSRSKKRVKAKDRRWRIVIFDIPEKEKKKRDIFRESLRNLGFEKFQKSVFVTKFDVFKEVIEIVRFLGIESYVMLIKAQEIQRWKVKGE